MKPEIDLVLKQISSFTIIGLFALSLVLVTLWLIYRRRETKLQPECVDLEFEATGVRYRGYRYPLAGAPVMLMIHGYSGNCNNWREMALYARTRGFEVWVPNLRGHGKGSQRSEVNPHSSSDYGFESIIHFDMSNIVEEAVRQSGRKVSLVAHSMGGMCVKAYLGGAYMDSYGKISFSSERAELRCQTQVNNAILIGSPFRFGHFPSFLKWFTKLLPDLSTQLQFMITAPSSKPQATGSLTNSETNTDAKNPSGLALITGAIRTLHTRLLTELGTQITERDFIKGLINSDNFDANLQELRSMLTNGVSKVHRDLIRDVNLWAASGRIETRSGANLSIVHSIKVPLLFVAGDLDRLAVNEDVTEESQLYNSAGIKNWLILMKNTSHVDLISGNRAANLLGKYVVNFSRNPKSLGRKLRIEVKD